MSFLLKSSDASPLAALIRKAAGFTETEDVEVVTPTFDRPPTWTPAMLPPADSQSWAAFAKMSADDLRAWGCRCFAPFTETPPTGASVSRADAWYFPVEDDKRATHELWLFPAEWYDDIPNGFPLVDINGCIETFERGRTDNDRRFGLLAYGVMIRADRGDAHHGE